MIRSLIVSILAISSALTAAAEPVYLYGRTIWTGTSQGTITDGVVVIENDRIVSVGPARANMPAGESFDWITPGLISAF